MDTKIAQMSSFATEISFDQLPEEVVTKAVDHIVDSVGCAWGGFNSDAASIARRTTSHSPNAFRRGVVLGEPELIPTAAEAAFLNTVRIRYLDASDHYPGGHPSDMLGPLWALSEGVSGRDLITGFIASYEVFIRYCQSARLREHGWDQGFNVAVGTCVGLSAMLHLSPEVTANALRLAAVSCMPMRATRSGSLSQWKGCATALAGKIAVDSVILASEGMDGPDAPIEGRHGLQDLVTGPFDIAPFPLAADDDYLSLRTNLKAWPVCYHLQLAVWAGIDASKLGQVEELESVDVAMYWAAWDETACEANKWRPTSRETADHSLPYIFMHAMKYGGIDASAFEPDAYMDPFIVEQMGKLTARVDDELEARFPDHVEIRATLKFRGREPVEIKIDSPRGHWKDPLSRADIDRKYLLFANEVLEADDAKASLAAWWELPERDDVGALLGLSSVR